MKVSIIYLVKSYIKLFCELGKSHIRMYLLLILHDDESTLIHLTMLNLFTDVDECLNPSSCSHICENTVGSYKCRCHKGYRLSPRDHRCRAEGIDISIALLVSYIQLRHLSSHAVSVYFLDNLSNSNFIIFVKLRNLAPSS